jgi:hypothetical protein
MGGEAHFVGDYDHGHAVSCKAAHDLQHFPHQFGIEGGGRFVEEHEMRFHGERAGDGDTLLLAARHAQRKAVALLREADTF